MARSLSLIERPRRNRKTDAMRRMVRETSIAPDHLILPMFVIEGKGEREEIASMPGVSRLSIDNLVEQARHAYSLGIPAVALFPALGVDKKDPLATESTNADGLLQRSIKALKDAQPELMVITDVAMDPYSTDGHDGLVEDGKIVNDPTLEILANMAIAQAEAGADVVAPSDMMDGRIGFIREALDACGHTEVSILAYSAKYASAFYGPFRDALDSAPRYGDKKTYQMDPANVREAIREIATDIAEGADMVMVKPALPYLDVIAVVAEHSTVPVVAYNVSGEYAMIKFAAEAGCLDEKKAMAESLLSIRRAGADVILTYFAMEMAELLNG
ncbi:MAG: porphobilinogen synthase [Deltaproteobacteria bacterium]|nr:porphobilinogen synthase [Deltaproteobacteria bacterium]